MKIISGNMVNTGGWCWINGLAIIMYLSPQTIFRDTGDVECLRVLSDIFRNDILKIVHGKIPKKKWRKRYRQNCISFIKEYTLSEGVYSKDLKKCLKKKDSYPASAAVIFNELTGLDNRLVRINTEVGLIDYLNSCSGIHLISIIPRGDVAHSFTLFRIGGKTIINCDERFFIYKKFVSSSFLKRYYGENYKFNFAQVYTHNL